jgi:hypothetical protein
LIAAAQPSSSWAIESPALGVGGVSLSGIAPGMARGRAIAVVRLARLRPGNLAADGEERPLTSPKEIPHPPLRRLQLFN